MALIQIGTVSDLALETIAPREAVPEQRVQTLGTAAEGAPADQYRSVITRTPRGLALSKVLLRPGRRDLMSRLLLRSVPVYIVAWAWDLSGRPIEVYPVAVSGVENCTIPVGRDVRERTFSIGAGAPLFQPRQVYAGIAIRVQLWQSKGGVRNFGSTIANVATMINSSELNRTLILLAAGTGIPGITLAAIAKLAGKVAEGVGNILKDSGDRFIDYFDGYFPATDPWSKGLDGPHIHEKTEITFRRLV